MSDVCTLPARLCNQGDAMFKRELKGLVGSVLEKEYKLDIATSDKVLEIFFSTDYLPRWYFYSNSVATIARHIYLYTQLLSANSRYLEDVNEDGKSITYFVNIGRDNPGRLERLIEENLDMDIGSFNAEYTKSGVSIVTLTKQGRSGFKVPENQWQSIKNMLREAKSHGEKNNFKYYVDFLNSIQLDYLSEEVTSHTPGVRLFRHMELFENSLKNDGVTVKEDLTPKIIGDKKTTHTEKRVSVAVPNCNTLIITKILKEVEKAEISMNRVYYDLLEGDRPVGILAIYTEPELELGNVISNIGKIEKGEKHSTKDDFEANIDNIIRALTTLDSKDSEFIESIKSLIELCRENSDISNNQEYYNFYLNSVTDFIKACDFLELTNNYDVLSVLLGYESLDEFFVSCREGNTFKNKPGYRAKHNSARGPNKGGLRIDPIVRFDEVAALSFMMTWKCSRSKILFGGGKGGLMLQPRDFANNKMDFFDTLSNFGRSIFAVTGPLTDVPAGDVGCGAREIGHLFEGFKSALRDLSLLVLGVKKGVSTIGNKIISVEEARTILKNNFAIDYLDKDVLKELAASEEYLNLVVAPQITGKPKMGIEARTGATGRGLCYSILSVVSNLYLDGKWEVSETLGDDEEALLEFACSTHDEYLNGKQWDVLGKVIYPKLFRGKKVVVQGFGKVGSSIIKELLRYGVNIISVADAGGAVIGNNLTLDDLLDAVKAETASVISTTKNVERVIKGAREGSKVLELGCDILIPAALENAITMDNANKIEAKIIACGSNGPCSSKAEEVLYNRGIFVIYDFLANGAGVTASYFEWLRNLNSRFKYEAEVIKNSQYDDSILDEYIMPDFIDRIKGILALEEGQETTRLWNLLLRDIIFTEVNEDYQFFKDNRISFKTAGFINSLLRVLTAEIIKNNNKLYLGLSGKCKGLIKEFFYHPETELFSPSIDKIRKELFS